MQYKYLTTFLNSDFLSQWDEISIDFIRLDEINLIIKKYIW